MTAKIFKSDNDNKRLIVMPNSGQGQTLRNMKAQKKLTRQNRETLRRLDHAKKLRLRNNKVEIENSIHLGMRDFLNF